MEFERRNMDYELSSPSMEEALAKDPTDPSVVELEKLMHAFNRTLHTTCARIKSERGLALIPEIRIGFDRETGLQMLSLARLTAVLKDNEELPPGVRRLYKEGPKFVAEDAAECAAPSTALGS